MDSRIGGARRANWLVVGDPLRGVAAFGVLLFHVASGAVLTARHPSSLGVAGRVLFNLDAGVFLFFVLSGYLIGRPFASAFVLQTPLPDTVRFLLKRIRRLMPGMVAATLLALVLLGSEGVSPARLLAVVGFAQVYAPSQFAANGTVHFWTLDAEGAFYLLLPGAAAAGVFLLRRLPGPRRRALLWLLGCALLAIVSLDYRGRGSVGDLDHQQVFASVAFAFAPGLALAGLEPVAEPLARVRAGRARALAGVLLAAACVALVAYFASGRQDFVLHALLATVACAAVLGAAVLTAWSGAPPWRALDNRALQWLGERSYSLYLFHVPIVVFMTKHVLGHGSGPAARLVVLAAVAIPPALVAAEIGHVLVERPFMSGRAPKQTDVPALAEPYTARTGDS